MANLSAPQKLAIVKRAHEAIYILNVMATLYMLYAAVTKTYNMWLYFSILTLIIEAVALVIGGKKCPLTDWAKYYGDPKGYVGSSFISEKTSRRMFLLFSLIGAAAVTILILNVLKVR